MSSEGRRGDGPRVERVGSRDNAGYKSLKRLDPSGRLMEYGVWPIWNETVGDMIARNPKNHADKWLVAAQYFSDNFEPLEP